MEDWSRWLLNSLVERTTLSGLCTAGELAVIAQDASRSPEWWSVQLAGSPDITQRLIDLANSVAFGQGLPAPDLSLAIGALGHQAARNLIFRELLERMFPARGRDWIALAPRWRHALAIAAAAGTIARSLRLPPGEVFVAGLLHDIGRLILLRHGGTPYERLERQYGASPDPLELCRQEEAYLGFDHALLGAAVAARWGLPSSVVSLLRDHHRLVPLRSAILAGSHLTRVAVLDLAEQYALQLGYGQQGGEEVSLDVPDSDGVLNTIASSPANAVLRLSRTRLRDLGDRIDAQIPVVLRVAKGGEGELWEGPGWRERISTWLEQWRSAPVEVPLLKTPVPQRSLETEQAQAAG